MPEDGTEYKIATSVYFAIKRYSSGTKIEDCWISWNRCDDWQKQGIYCIIRNFNRKTIAMGYMLAPLNELPLRHVFQNLDGVTSGPDSFRDLLVGS